MSPSSSKFDPLQVFGETVRDVRLEKKLTQAVVAERADVHVNYISEVENGHRNISLVNILWFARALDVEPWELLRRFDTRKLKSLPRKGDARLRPARER